MYLIVFKIKIILTIAAKQQFEFTCADYLRMNKDQSDSSFFFGGNTIKRKTNHPKMMVKKTQNKMTDIMYYL